MSDRYNFKIKYEDNHLLVVEKPPNMLVQVDQTGDEDLLTVMKEDIRRRYNKPGNVYLGLVHRLDRPAGGAMVFAKTSKAASRLSDQVRNRTFEKTYLAVVHGLPGRPSGPLVYYLIKDAAANTVKAVDISSGKNSSGAHPDIARIEGRRKTSGKTGNAGSENVSTISGAKKAVLDYKVTDTADGLSLVQIKLHTGRPHQIRVQLASIGHPLYGDQKYGTSLNKPGMQLALWSAEIGFIHPTLRERVVYSSDPPSVYPWNLFA